MNSETGAMRGSPGVSSGAAPDEVGAAVRRLPATQSAGVEMLEGALWIDHRSEPPTLKYRGLVEPLAPESPSRVQRATVRLFDLAIAVPAFVLLLPVTVVVAVTVAATSPGPVLFRSRRITRNGQYFDMYKFRTMVTNGDEVLEDHFAAHPDARERYLRHMKLETDPRVTSVGAFLRRWSLDELPQLWNVIRGHMSIVGPRPLVSEEFLRFGSAVDTVLRVKGGMTGLWQVEGRNLLTFEQRVPLDVRYARTRGLVTDGRIIVKTLWQLLRGRPGAF